MDASTVDEYLSGEELSEIRHEYYGGTVVAIRGASAVHNLISGNIYTSLRAQLRGGPCQVFIHDMKVQLHVSDTEVFYYPDVFVACNPEDNHSHYRSEPKVIIEVLSEATEHKDRIEKFLAYQTIPSVQEYILVSQDREQREVSVYHRDDGWKRQRIEGDTFDIPSIQASLSLNEIYDL